MDKKQKFRIMLNEMYVDFLEENEYIVDQSDIILQENNNKTKEDILEEQLHKLNIKYEDDMFKYIRQQLYINFSKENLSKLAKKGITSHKTMFPPYYFKIIVNFMKIESFSQDGLPYHLTYDSNNCSYVSVKWSNGFRHYNN